MRCWLLFSIVLLVWSMHADRIHAQEAVAPVPPQSLSACLGLLPEAAPGPPRGEVLGRLREEGARNPRRFHPTRFWAGLGGFVAVDVPVALVLSQLWYPDSLRTSFHFYSNNPNVGGAGGPHDHGWLDDWYTYVQQDKLGHLWTTWHLARAFGAYGRWAGLSNAHAGLFGGVMAILFQTQIEISDGFSAKYGFSRTDMLANLVGGVMGGLRVAYPGKLRWLAAKYSYHRSPYFDERVSDSPVLRYAGNAIKDYDGISYWLVVRPEYLLRGRARRLWPDWLALSIGYSADGIRHAISGEREQRLGPGPGLEHRRVLLIGLDFDFLHALDVPEPWHTLANLLSFIRLPAPALALTPELRGYWLYF